MKLADQPAFPQAPVAPVKLGEAIYPPHQAPHPGITFRQYAAVMAMQGMLANPDTDYNKVASVAPKLADALIAELEKP